MTEDSAEKIWLNYLAASGNVPKDERRRLLEASVSKGVVSTNPAEETNGLEALIAHVDAFQERLPGASFQLKAFMFHHGQALAEWTLHKADCTPLRTAHTFGRFDDEDRLVVLTGFF